MDILLYQIGTGNYIHRNPRPKFIVIILFKVGTVFMIPGITELLAKLYM